jgi:hypothetical protein
MNRLRLTLLAAGAALFMAPAVFAGSVEVARRAGITRQSVSGTGYAVEVEAVVRVQGSAFFRTLVAINNNTNTNGVTATLQYAYTCFAATCSPVGGFYYTPPITITLKAMDSFEQDDFVEYLFMQGALAASPGAEQGSIGTLLVNFNNLPSANGWEGNAVARTYNRINESDPSQGTVGFAYNASLFFDSAHYTLVGYARDTKANPTIAGKLRANMGVRSTDLASTGNNVTVILTFYDTATGNRVGNAQTFADLRPGELRQVSDIWATAQIPSSVNSVIAFADVQNVSATTPTIEGFITIIEGQNTNDAAIFEARCGDPTFVSCGCPTIPITAACP